FARWLTYTAFCSSIRRRHTRCYRDWSSDVCSSDLLADRHRKGLERIPRSKISSPVHPELAGAVVVHGIEGVPAAKLEQELWQRRRIRVRSMGDQLGVRQSCQIYNSEAEVDATLDVVRDLPASA